jgi:hypothetical protein
MAAQEKSTEDVGRGGQFGELPTENMISINAPTYRLR